MQVFRHQMTVSYLNPFLEIYRAWQSFLEHDNCLALLLIKLDFSDTECNGRFPNFWIWNTYGWVEKKKNTYNSSILIGIKQNLNTSFRKRNQIYNTDNMHIWIQNASRWTSLNRITYIRSSPQQETERNLWFRWLGCLWRNVLITDQTEMSFKIAIP